MSNLSETSKILELGRWNSNLAHELLPVTIFLGLYLVVGLIGNSVVLYIYLVRFKNRFEDRFLVPVLAAIDLMACCITAPSSISVNSLPVRFDNDILCKLLTFFVMASTLASEFMILLIAVHRYLKICKPFGRKMTRTWKKRFVLIICVTTLILSVPSFVFYGSAPVESTDLIVTGRRCTSVTGGAPIIAIVFKIFLFLITVVVMIVLSVLYLLIGKRILKQTHLNCHLTTGFKTTRPKEKSDIDKETKLDTWQQRETTAGKTKHMQKSYAQKSPGVNLRRRIVPGYRLSLIFMIITVIFIVCFIPKMVLMVYESQRKDFWLKLSSSQLVGFRFLYTFYIINNIVNPFIYGFLDRKFQKELKSMFCSRNGNMHNSTQ